MTMTARIARLLNVRLLLSITCVLIFVSPVFGDTIYFGSATDATGDSTTGNNDLVFASAGIDQAGVLTLEARFAPGSFLPRLPFTRTDFYFDLDRNPATGLPGTPLNGDSESAIFGTDTQVQLIPFPDSSASLLTWNGADFTFVTDNYTFTTVADGYNLTLPLLDLGITDGRFNFKVAYVQVGFRGFTTISDRLTNLNAPSVSTTAVPEPTSFSFLAIGLTLLLLVCVASLIEFPPMSFD